MYYSKKWRKIYQILQSNIYCFTFKIYMEINVVIIVLLSILIKQFLIINDLVIPFDVFYLKLRTTVNSIIKKRGLKCSCANHRQKISSEMRIICAVFSMACVNYWKYGLWIKITYYSIYHHLNIEWNYQRHPIKVTGISMALKIYIT